MKRSKQIYWTCHRRYWHVRSIYEMLPTSHARHGDLSTKVGCLRAGTPSLSTSCIPPGRRVKLKERGSEDWGRGTSRICKGAQPLVGPHEAESLLSISVQKRYHKLRIRSLPQCPRKTASRRHDQPPILVNGEVPCPPSWISTPNGWWRSDANLCKFDFGQNNNVIILKTAQSKLVIITG